MSCTEILKARVSPETKLQAKAIADRESLTEAAWIKRIVIREIRACCGPTDDGASTRRVEGVRRPDKDRQPRGASGRPLFVRLRSEDRLLLDARAEARGLRPATYATVLLRAHLRELTPLPKEELLALKRCIGELAAIGRNINQIAKAANDGGRLPATVRDEFRAMLKICEALRDNTKALLKANETSWSTGHAEAPL
jgi:hypothetical protein